MADEGNPLVATVDTGSWGGTANLESTTYEEGDRKGQFSTDALSKDTEGAGLFSDAASTIGDASSGNWGGLAIDAVGDGMDALGMAMDPLGSLAGAGIGWLIEHIGFLKKFLDLLAGDPEAVTAKAQTWTNVAKALSDAADQYEQSAQKLKSGNTSDAVDGASATGANLSQVLHGASSHATDAATAMKVSATAVGTTRGIIRDTLSQFAGDAIVKWIAATAAAFFTFGATEAAFVVDEVAEGASLAAENASKVSKLLEALTHLKGGAKDSEDALKNAATDLDRGVKDTDSIAHDASDAAPSTSPEGHTAPADTSGSTTPASDTPSDPSGPSSADGPTAPADTGGGGTTPSEAPADPGSPPSTDGPTAPSDEAGGGSTTPSETPATPAATKQHYWQKEDEKPSHDEVQEHVDTQKQKVADHNDQVATHNQKADQLKQDTEEHNQQAVDNQQKLAANKHATDMNQQAINRARAQGKDHSSLNAQHRQLTDEHKSLTAEDQRLSQRQGELNQRNQDLHQEGTDLNKQATDLRTKQHEVAGEKGDDMLRRGSLENESLDGNKLVNGLRTAHKIWEGPVEGIPMGDIAKEPFAQQLSDQQTRNDAVGYESQTQQQEFAEEQEKSTAEPAWPTADQPG
jgi:hypothetical protein